MRYTIPCEPGSLVSFKSQYDNYIGGIWVAPVKGQYFEDSSPVTSQTFCAVPRSTPKVNS